MSAYQPNQRLQSGNTGPNLLISACIQGQEVRYNGGHKKNHWLADNLSKHCTMLPLCPEVDMGMGVPRPTIQVQVANGAGHPDLIGSDGQVHTGKANQQQEQYKAELPWTQLDGMILQAKSPSCGLERVNHYNKQGHVDSHHGQGIFAHFFCEQAPDVPKLDSGRLHNPELRQQFLIALYAHYRFRIMTKTPAQLQSFHRSYKYLLMECNAEALKRMGQIAASATDVNMTDTVANYRQLLISTLQILPSKGKRANGFEHVMGYLKQHISATEKQYLLKLLDNYRNELCGFEIPRAVLRYLINLHQVDYIKQQYYFDPFPEVLLSA